MEKIESLDDWLMAFCNPQLGRLKGKGLDKFIRRRALEDHFFDETPEYTDCPKFIKLYLDQPQFVLTTILTSPLFKSINASSTENLNNLLYYLGSQAFENYIDITKMPFFRIETENWRQIHENHIKVFVDSFDTTIRKFEYFLISVKIFLSELWLNQEQEKALRLAESFQLLVKSIQHFLSKLFYINENLTEDQQESLENELNTKKPSKSEDYELQESINFHLWKHKICVYQLVDIFKNNDLALAMIIEDLANSPASRRHKWRLEFASYLISEFPNIKISDKIKDKLVSVPPRTCLGLNTEFGPLDKQSEILIDLNEKNVVFVDTVQAVRDMTIIGKYVGLDSEWRSNIPETRPNPVSILQIACQGQVYIIDLKALNRESELDEFLLRLLQGGKVKLGVSFQDDLKYIKRDYPHMKAAQVKMKNYVDLVDAYKRVKLVNPGGLAGLCEKVIGKNLSKYEQMSNWDDRPLRKSQMHYAALDAYVQIEIFGKIFKDCGIGEEEFFGRFDGNVTSCNTNTVGERCKICFRQGHLAENCRY